MTSGKVSLYSRKNYEERFFETISADSSIADCYTKQPSDEMKAVCNANYYN